MILSKRGLQILYFHIQTVFNVSICASCKLILDEKARDVKLITQDCGHVWCQMLDCVLYLCLLCCDFLCHTPADKFVDEVHMLPTDCYMDASIALFIL